MSTARGPRCWNYHTDFKAAMVTMLHELKLNIPEVNRKIEVLGREIKTVKKNQTENFLN